MEITEKLYAGGTRLVRYRNKKDELMYTIRDRGTLREQLDRILDIMNYLSNIIVAKYNKHIYLFIMLITLNEIIKFNNNGNIINIIILFVLLTCMTLSTKKRIVMVRILIIGALLALGIRWGDKNTIMLAKGQDKQNNEQLIVNPFVINNYKNDNINEYKADEYNTNEYNEYETDEYIVSEHNEDEYIPASYKAGIDEIIEYAREILTDTETFEAILRKKYGERTITIIVDEGSNILNMQAPTKRQYVGKKHNGYMYYESMEEAIKDFALWEEYCDKHNLDKLKMYYGEVK